MTELNKSGVFSVRTNHEGRARHSVRAFVATDQARRAQKMKRILFGCIVCSVCLIALGEGKPVYENHFEKETVGQAPPDFLILDGGFVVKEENNNKFLELPGTPLDSFSVQFGPAQTDNVAVSARINGTSKGRRYPTFGLGINGSAGYRLQVSPGKKTLELLKDQEIKKSIPYVWKSGQWTKLRLQLRKVKDGEWKVEAKAWEEGGSEPQQWMLSSEETEAPSTGRPSVFASPFSGTPLQFDDFVLTTVE